MSHELSLKEIKKEWHGTLKSYVVGFLTSLFLTTASFFLVYTHLFPKENLIFIIISLGLVQAIIQAVFFLHVGQESKPRWETIIFCFMILILLIIAIGSLWIMYDLNNRVMSDMIMEMPHD